MNPTITFIFAVAGTVLGAAAHVVLLIAKRRKSATLEKVAEDLQEGANVAENLAGEK